jgi:predicted RNase H-like HicB family nuclease
MTVRVYLDEGRKRTFAAALDWPGWARSGRTAEEALDALQDYLPRYAVAVHEAGLEVPSADAGFEVVERVPGTATTDFGALGSAPSVDLEPLADGEGERLAALVAASWSVFDVVVSGAPPVLRKGPRGGGRDRDQVVAHVLNAEAAYVRTLGITARGAKQNVAPEVTWRDELLGLLRSARSAEPVKERGWPPRYAARRIAWHVLDHAWEIEDKSEP